jgi:gluconolactonase
VIVVGTTPADYEGGRIERVDLATGRSERIYTACGEHGLRGPNDLVFDRTGGFWFTDLGKHFPRSRDASGLYYARPDGSAIAEAVYGALSFNGVGLSPDEQTLYVADTMSARLWGNPLSASGEIAAPPPQRHNPARLVGTAPGDVMLDSLAVTEAGDICVGTLMNGGITTFTPAGETRHTALPEPYVTNICFGGSDRQTAFITLATTGKVVKCRWPEPGLALNFCTY